MDELKQELENKNEIIDAFTTAVRTNKDEVKKLKAENEKLKSQQTQKDDLQRKTQSDYEQLRDQLAEALSKLQRYSCQHSAAERGSESVSTYLRHRDIQFGSDSYRSSMTSLDRQDVCDLGSQPSEECTRTFEYAIMPKMDKLRNTYLVVGAIHIGVSMSSIAFSFRDEFERDPSKIKRHCWCNGSEVGYYTRTALLFNQQKTSVMFGYEAVHKYDELESEEQHNQYFFFKDFTRPFKRVASVSVFDENLMVEDDFNRKIPFITILSMSIEYMAGVFFRELDKCFTDIDRDEIRLVLTIPPSSTNCLQKMYGKSCWKGICFYNVKRAGIQLNNLTLVLLPIADFVDFIYSGNTGRTSPIVKELTKYMIMEIEGAATNVSIIDVGKTGDIIGCSYTSDDTGGGVIEEKMLEQFFVNILGKNVYGKFCEDNRFDYIDLLRDFNTRRYQFEKDTITLMLPVSLTELYVFERNQEIKEAVAECTAYKGKIRMLGRQKITVDTKVFKGMFNEFLSKRVKCIKDMFKGKTNLETDAIILVKGLLDYTFTRDALQQHFPMNRLFILDEERFSVLRGAVMWGHDTDMNILSEKYLAKMTRTSMAHNK